MSRTTQVVVWVPIVASGLEGEPLQRHRNFLPPELEPAVAEALIYRRTEWPLERLPISSPSLRAYILVLYVLDKAIKYCGKRCELNLTVSNESRVSFLKERQNAVMRPRMPSHSGLRVSNFSESTPSSRVDPAVDKRKR